MPRDRLDDVVDLRGSWTAMIHAGLRLVGIACCAANIFGGFAVALLLVDSSAAARLGLALILKGQLAILVAVAGNYRSRWLAAIALVCTVLGAALAVPTTTWVAGPAAWWPAQFVMTLVAYLVYAEPAPTRWWLVGWVIVANAAARILSWPAAPSSDAILVPQLAVETSQFVLMAVTVYLTVTALFDAAARADAARAQARDRRQAEQRASARVTQAREVDRFIHDEVLHSLRTIALDREAVPAERATYSARRLAGLLSGMPSAPEEPDLTTALEQAAARSPLRVTVAGPRPMCVPPGVHSAFVRAVEESLRNVSRHAREGAAHVRLRRTGLTVVVTVSDQGVGFDPTSVDERRRGVSASIDQRMSDVGGSASVRSRPGQGTVVTLRWRPPLAGSDRPEQGIAARGPERLAPAGVAAYLPYLLANPWLAFWMAPQLTEPMAGWAGSVGAVAAGVAGTVVGLRRGLRGWHSAVLVAVAWCASLANGLALPAGSTNTALYWLAGGVTAILYLQVLLRPLREAVLTGVGLTAIAGWCVLRVLDVSAGIVVYLPALLSPALAVACAVLLGRTVDAMGWEVLRSEEAAVEAAASRQVAADFDREVRVRMDRRRAAVLDFVTCIADGRLDVSDRQVQRAAAELERLLREQLWLPVPGRVEEAVRRLGEQGVAIVVRAAPDVPGTVAEVTAQALDGFAAAGPWPPGTTLQVTATPSRPSWRVALLAMHPCADLRRWTAGFAADHGWELSADPDGVHLVRRVALPAPSMTDVP